MPESDERDYHICDTRCPGCDDDTYCVSCDLCEKCPYQKQDSLETEDD